MDLAQLIIVIIVVGMLLWLVNNFVPMDAKIRRILNVVVIIALILWLLSAFGVFSMMRGVPIVPR